MLFFAFTICGLVLLFELGSEARSAVQSRKIWSDEFNLLQSAQMSPLETFQRYSNKTRAFIKKQFALTARVALYAYFIIYLVNIFIPTGKKLSDIQLFGFFFLIYFVEMAIISIVIRSWVFLQSDINALATIAKSAITPKNIFTTWLRKLFIVEIIEFVIFGSISFMAIMMMRNALFVAIAVALANFIISKWLQTPISLFTGGTIPLEQTGWGSRLAKKVSALNAVFGTKITGIHIATNTTPRCVNTRISGLTEPVVVLSDLFVQHSDLRQQEAMIAYLLVEQRHGVYLKQWLLLSVSLGVYLVALLLITLLSPDIHRSTLLGAFPMIALLIQIFISRFSNSRRALWAMKADEESAHATGDALALLVALNTLEALNGMLPIQGLLSPKDVILSRRKAALERIVQEQAILSNKSFHPVSSIAVVTIGQNQVTIPLASPPRSGPAPHNPAQR